MQFPGKEAEQVKSFCASLAEPSCSLAKVGPCVSFRGPSPELVFDYYVCSSFKVCSPQLCLLPVPSSAHCASGSLSACRAPCPPTHTWVPVTGQPTLLLGLGCTDPAQNWSELRPNERIGRPRRTRFSSWWTGEASRGCTNSALPIS